PLADRLLPAWVQGRGQRRVLLPLPRAHRRFHKRQRRGHLRGLHDETRQRAVLVLRAHGPAGLLIITTCGGGGVRSLAFRQFVKRKDLDSLYLADGWATIPCGVIVTGRGRDNDPLVAPPPDIGTHLGLLLDCADGSDVSFVVDGARFPAHRAVLAARSPVFKAQLLGPTAKARASSVTVPDMAPATFRAMLRFVYTNACPEDGELGGSPSEVYPRLLAAADRYALDRLKLVCAGKLWGNVSANTVAATLACAKACSCPELKTKCVGFLVDENFRDAVLTDGFVQLVQKFPSMIAELKEAVGKQ
ncbi:hypothetical protein PVAP13_6KG349300, partial [Panicum virgatum]